MDMKSKIHKLNKTQCQNILFGLLNGYQSPAFGSLPKREIDLLFLTKLEELGYIPDEPAIYDLVSRLKVTRSKARSLIYEMALRKLDSKKLDRRVKDSLRSPLLQKQQNLYGLEIENPLVIDHLRSILQIYGHASDGSFSPSLVRITLDGLVALIEHFLTKEEIEVLEPKLIKAGAPDKSFKGALKAIIKSAAGKIAKDSGEAVVDSMEDYIGPILDGTLSDVANKFAILFNKPNEVEK